MYVTLPTSCLKTSTPARRCIKPLYRARSLVKLILRLGLLV